MEETYIPVNILNKHKLVKDMTTSEPANKGTVRQTALSRIAAVSALLWLRSFLVETKILDIKAPKTVHPRKVL